MKYKTQFRTILLVLVLAAIACQVGTRPPALPTELPQIPTALPPLPTLDPNLSDKFEDEWQKAIVEAVTTGNFSVTITEGQLTELINRKNAEDPNATLSNIQVFLRNGQIQIYSNAATEAGSTTLQITATVAVTEAGIQLNVISAQLGIFPIPESLLSSISESINSALNGQDTAGAENIQIQSIEIAEGYMTITGTLK